MWLQECIDFAQIWKELQNQKVVVFYPRLQRWVDQINLLNVEWFALWNIMCVNMHHTHSDRNNILFLLRSCIYWVQKEKKRELRKVSTMHIILIIDFGLNPCDNLQKEWTSGNISICKRWNNKKKNTQLEKSVLHASICDLFQAISSQSHFWKSFQGITAP